MSTLEKSVDKIFEGRKIREYLKEEMGLSSRLISGAAIDKRILVNNNPVRMNYVLKENDKIVINLNKKESQNIEPEKIDIDIVYEDSEIIVVNKRPNMVVHPTKRYQSGTLANALLYYFKETNQDCIVRLVSRLDMDTSGLIIIAKNQYAHMELSKNMQDNEIEKRYLTLVHGHMEEVEGTIDKPIYRPEVEGNLKRVIDDRGQRSITHYKVIERLENADLVECLLETGRTHQIRVHLSSLGHPIYGDTLYGYEEDSELISRQALHAYGLNFKSPKSKKYLELRAELPTDIENLLLELRK
ncbi:MULTISPECIES: RluA family pseudouridine synthase [unclassified Clostridium]|jgi:23S rRNA pseudouridine1911/1915/1917 synthase|uniref:RluA family pseudouridine synthase n=1 Tax=Clostridium TaxID=1485 RepID=UPI001C8CBD04|nr:MULTISPECIES: RluA family pseudouridine synthase [unclassified Clostridium]MBX9136532.1 RluA family pseudouridine synthase [Clostridium sp. K12(2020)]MBX9142987.1 RluA family pseudouridine synthase [Clostridium sp. K13]MDU2290773.1 RluA family pseudouridine synthase [Clostridium celatum]MDU4325340.1 RluA family pseudouridine synthase [Clostridium celatum]